MIMFSARTGAAINNSSNSENLISFITSPLR
jgi:hypothetical protein